MVVIWQRWEGETFGAFGLRLAEHEGLGHEYLRSYAEYRDAGYSDENAAYHALYDWDI